MSYDEALEARLQDVCAAGGNSRVSVDTALTSKKHDLCCLPALDLGRAPMNCSVRGTHSKIWPAQVFETSATTHQLDPHFKAAQPKPSMSYHEALAARLRDVGGVYGVSPSEMTMADVP